MRVGDLLGVLRRRWLLVIVGILLTAGLSGGAYVTFKPTYEVTATVLMLPPAPQTPGTGSTNPYLQLSGLQQVVDLVGVSLTDQAKTLELEAISKDVEFTVKADTRTDSPLLVIDVKDSSPETAVAIRDNLVASVPVRLAEMQQALAVSQRDQVTSTVLTLDAQPEEIGKNRVRAAVVAGGLGLALALVAATVWDAHRIRHPRRQASPRRPATDRKDADPEEPSSASDQPAERRSAGAVESPANPTAVEELAGVSDDLG
jgi:uncharacterized protein involved in exopolysaccharide biosynthesis